jgi:hypothetical protein
MLAAETLTRVWPPRRLLHILKAAAIFGTVFITVAAARLLPVVDQLRHHTRALDVETDALQKQTLVDMYLSRGHELHVAGQTYVWGEYIAYLGILLVGFALLGMLLTKREEAWYPAVAALMFLLMLGHFATLAPWHILKTYVFPWKSMRVPVRFRLLLLAFLAGWVGMAVDRLPAALGRWFGHRFGNASRTLVLGLALVGAGDAMGYATTVAGPRFNAPPEQAVVPSARLYIGGPGMAPFIDQPRQNRGRLECWEEWNFTAGAPQWTGDVPQAKPGDKNVVVEVANRTQNTFTIDVDAKAPARVLVNVPYDRGWRTDAGEVADQSKLLVVDVPAGRRTIHLKYWPQGLTAGLWLTTLGLAGVIAYFVWRRQRARRAI